MPFTDYQTVPEIVEGLQQKNTPLERKRKEFHAMIFPGSTAGEDKHRYHRSKVRVMRTAQPMWWTVSQLVCKNGLHISWSRGCTDNPQNHMVDWRLL